MRAGRVPCACTVCSTPRGVADCLPACLSVAIIPPVCCESGLLAGVSVGVCVFVSALVRVPLRRTELDGLDKKIKATRFR